MTFHPVTMENNTGVTQVKELIKAMNAFPKMNYIVTMANADAGGRSINDIWCEEGQKHSNWLVVTSLGVVRYLSAMKYSKAVIGNSSSGIVEAPSMRIPTVNIGDRQKGRMLAESVMQKTMPVRMPRRSFLRRFVGAVCRSAAAARIRNTARKQKL